MGFSSSPFLSDLVALDLLLDYFSYSSSLLYSLPLRADFLSFFQLSFSFFSLTFGASTEPSELISLFLDRAFSSFLSFLPDFESSFFFLAQMGSSTDSSGL